MEQEPLRATYNEEKRPAPSQVRESGLLYQSSERLEQNSKNRYRFERHGRRNVNL